MLVYFAAVTQPYFRFVRRDENLKYSTASNLFLGRSYLFTRLVRRRAMTESRRTGLVVLWILPVLTILPMRPIRARSSRWFRARQTTRISYPRKRPLSTSSELAYLDFTDNNVVGLQNP